MYLHFKNLWNFKNTSLYIRTNGLLKDNKISRWQRITHLPWFFQDTIVLKSSRAGRTESIGIFPRFSFYYYKFHVQYPGVWSPCGWSYWTVDVRAGKTSKTIWSNILILQMMKESPERVAGSPKVPWSEVELRPHWAPIAVKVLWMDHCTNMSHSVYFRFNF